MTRAPRTCLPGRAAAADGSPADVDEWRAMLDDMRRPEGKVVYEP